MTDPAAPGQLRDAISSQGATTGGHEELLRGLMEGVQRLEHHDRALDSLLEQFRRLSERYPHSPSLQPSFFPSDRSKVAYLITLMSTRALTWATAVWEQQLAICVSLEGSWERRMKEHNMSVRECYSDMSDEELDQKVRPIKARMPHAGFRMVKGSLQAMVHRVQWQRVRESLQRVDGAGIIARMIQLRCIARQKYSVPAPLSLVHIDTNNKLIRYNIVIFGSIDGFSRKTFYLDTAANNIAATAFGYFMDGVGRNGWPSKVRADQGVKNLDIARCMFSAVETLLLASVHNQRVECLWRHVWSAVTCQYYKFLHSLEEEGYLDLSNSIHLFCVGYVFLPRLRADLQHFTEIWDNHPLSTEANLTPHQLWHIGMLQTPVSEPDYAEIQQVEDRDNLESGNTDNRVIVPDIPCPLSTENLAVLHRQVNPTTDSSSFGQDIYIACS
eukprot:XP_014016539.1 PREDICTED: uncharacterized protein LOC106580245 [Salmo salar]